jgi:hypothetical protein
LEFGNLEENEIKRMFYFEKIQNFEKISLPKMLVSTIKKIRLDLALRSQLMNLIKLRLVNPRN